MPEKSAPNTASPKNRAGIAFDEWWAQFSRKDLSPELIAWYAWVAAIMWSAPNGLGALISTAPLSIGLLVKLGSIIVHFEESQQPDGRQMDLDIAAQLLRDPEVQAWMKEMGAVLPLKRS